MAPLCAQAQKAAPAAKGPEDATRQQIDDATRASQRQTTLRKEAMDKAARAQAEENRLAAQKADPSSGAAIQELKDALKGFEALRDQVRGQLGADDSLASQLLAAADKLSRFPKETWAAAVGARRDDAGNGQWAMRQIAHELTNSAKALQKSRKALDDAEQKAVKAAALIGDLETARAREAEARTQALAAAHAARENAEKDAAEAAQKAASEAARAETLRSMLAVLETQRHLQEARAMEDARRAQKEQKPEAVEAAKIREAAVARPSGGIMLTPHAKPAGQLAAPVKGDLVKAWGDPDEGEPATGQSWKTAPGAKVVAPCGGTVAFAAPFRGYGPLVIIECGGGYHVVLSGMKSLGVAPGQTVRDTDPVGEMPSASAEPKPDSARAEVRPVLYFEFRKGGKPVNPAPWLRPSG